MGSGAGWWCCSLRHRFRVFIAFMLFLAIVAQNLCTFDIVYTLNAMVVPVRNESRAEAKGVGEDEGHAICSRAEPIEPVFSDSVLFEWDSETQGFVLASFALGSIFGTLVSIWIYDFFYLRILFSCGLFMGALNSLVLPAFSVRGSTPSTIINRIFSGFYTGIMVPGVAVATVTWFPVTERGRVQSFVMLGSNFGKLLFAFSGALIRSSGWPAMFYTTGGVGVTVAVLLFVIYSDDPSDNPCVSEEEESVIYDVPQEVLHTMSSETQSIGAGSLQTETERGGRRSSHGGEGGGRKWNWLPRAVGKFVRGIHMKVKKPAKPVKWSAVLTSLPYWVTVLAHFGVKYVTTASITYTQIYLQNIHGYSLTRTSILTSVVPNLSMIIFGLIVGYLNDKLLSWGYQKIHVRRMFGVVILLSALMFLLIPFLSCEQVGDWIILLLVLTSFRSGVYGSIVPTYQDLSPTFHKSLLSLSWTISLVGGIFVPMLMGYIGKDTRQQWNKIFIISACIIIFSVLAYVIFVDVEVQPWDPEHAKPLETREPDRDEGDLWLITNNDLAAYGIFKPTTKYIQRMAVGSEIQSLQKKNEFLSVFRDRGFAVFLRKYLDLHQAQRDALTAKYAKLKAD